MKINDLIECYRHKKSRTRYHLILVTKYRRKCITPDIKESFIAAFRECESKSNIRIYELNIDLDHIHLLLSFPPQYSISQTVNRLKQYTTNYIYIHHNSHIRKFYWRKKRALWSDSYFIATVGDVSEQIVSSYIKNQS